MVAGLLNWPQGTFASKVSFLCSLIEKAKGPISFNKRRHILLSMLPYIFCVCNEENIINLFMHFIFKV